MSATISALLGNKLDNKKNMEGNPFNNLQGSDARAEEELRRLTEEKIRRIAELDNKFKTIGLTPEEQSELVKLRQARDRGFRVE